MLKLFDLQNPDETLTNLWVYLHEIMYS